MWTREVGVMRDEPGLGTDQPDRADAGVCNRFRGMGGGSLLSGSVLLFARSKEGRRLIVQELAKLKDKYDKVFPTRPVVDPDGKMLLKGVCGEVWTWDQVLQSSPEYFEANIQPLLV